MRYQTVAPPKIGDRRTIRIFLLFPRTIGGEGRWFENAEILQERREYALDAFSPFECWEDISWVN